MKQHGNVFEMVTRCPPVSQKYNDGKDIVDATDKANARKKENLTAIIIRINQWQIIYPYKQPNQLVVWLHFQSTRIRLALIW